jgi:hypothetical protein
MMTRGVNLDIALDPGHKSLLEEAKVVNIQEEIIRMPFYKGGGKVGELLKDDSKMADKFLAPMVSRTLGISLEEFKKVREASYDEVEEYKTYGKCFMIWGQKREVSFGLN